MKLRVVITESSVGLDAEHEYKLPDAMEAELLLLVRLMQAARPGATVTAANALGGVISVGIDASLEQVFKNNKKWHLDSIRELMT